MCHTEEKKKKCYCVLVSPKINWWWEINCSKLKSVSATKNGLKKKPLLTGQGPGQPIWCDVMVVGGKVAKRQEYKRQLRLIGEDGWLKKRAIFSLLCINYDMWLYFCLGWWSCDFVGEVITSLPENRRSPAEGHVVSKRAPGRPWKICHNASKCKWLVV